MARLIVLCFVMCAALFGQQDADYTFGTTVVDSSGFEGHVFRVRPAIQKLPNLGHLERVGTIYTNTLNVWPQNFSRGFPGIADLLEWFAIRYTAKAWMEKAGEYRFSLLSDDGSTLRVDNKLVIDNDGIHPAGALSARAVLTRGTHEIQVDYMQGPRWAVALVLAIAPPNEPWRIFNTADFKPPPDPKDWVKGKISEIQDERLR